MKKSVIMTVSAALAVMMLAGCGSDAKTPESTAPASEESGEAAETEAEKSYADEAYLDYLNVDDYLELGEYAGVEVTLEAPFVSDEQVESYIRSVLSSNSEKQEVTGRAAQTGDVTDINFVGKIDGVAFDGGTADNYELTLGSNSFISGFEDGVVGMEIGETKDLNLTFPDPYKNNPDLAGSPVLFTVTLNKIYEYVTPELDDAFVAGLGIEDVATVEEYRQYVYDGLYENAQSQYDMNLESAVLKAVYENANIKAAPEAMAERYYDRLVSNMTYQAAMYGMDLDSLMLYYYGMEPEQYEADMKASAQEAAEQILMMQAIAEQEGLTVSDEEVETDLESRAADYGYESVDAYKEALGDEVKGYREFLMSERVTAYLVDHAKITQTMPETDDATEDTEETESTEDAESAGEEAAETQTSAEEN